LLWDTVEPDRWIDASTLIIHTSLAEMSRETEAGFGGDFLFTLKFDESLFRLFRYFSGRDTA